MNIWVDDRAVGQHIVWDEAAVARLRGMKASGLSSSQIAAELGTTKNAVIGKMKRLDDHVARPMKPWTPEDIERLAELAGSGKYHINAIAKEMDRSPTAIWSAMKREGIKSTFRREYKSRAKPRPEILKRAAPERQGAKGPVYLSPVSRTTPTQIAFLDLKSRSCRAPLWSDTARPSLAERFFCGASTEVGRSYCTECAALFYRVEEAA